MTLLDPSLENKLDIMVLELKEVLAEFLTEPGAFRVKIELFELETVGISRVEAFNPLFLATQDIDACARRPLKFMSIADKKTRKDMHESEG